MKEGREVQSHQIEGACFVHRHYMNGHGKYRQEIAKSIFPACIYLLHTELNGEILCNLYMLYKVSVHTVFNRVYSPVSAGEGMEESLAIATERVISGGCEAAAAANGRGEVQHT